MLFVSQLPPAGDLRACLGFYATAAVALAASIVATVARRPTGSIAGFALLSAALIGMLLLQNAPWTVVAALAVHAAFLVVLPRFCCDNDHGVGRSRRVASWKSFLPTRLAAITPPYNPADADAASREPLLSAAVGGVVFVVPAVALDRALEGADAGLAHNTLVLGAAVFAVGLVGFLARRPIVARLLSLGVMSQAVALVLAAWARFHDAVDVQTLVVLVLAVAVCHAATILVLPRLSSPDRTPEEDG